MAPQKVPAYNGIKDIPIPRRNSNIETVKEDGSELLTSRSTLSIANPVPSVLQIFFLILPEIENFIFRGVVWSGGSSH